MQILLFDGANNRHKKILCTNEMTRLYVIKFFELTDYFCVINFCCKFVNFDHRFTTKHNFMVLQNFYFSLSLSLIINKKNVTIFTKRSNALVDVEA